MSCRIYSANHEKIKVTHTQTETNNSYIQTYKHKQTQTNAHKRTHKHITDTFCVLQMQDELEDGLKSIIDSELKSALDDILKIRSKKKHRHQLYMKEQAEVRLFWL